MPRRLPPLQRARNRQHSTALDPLVGHAERDVQRAFADAQREALAVLAAFAKAYQAEYERLNEHRDEDEEPRKVPQAWLITSGWGKRVEHALAQAAQHAGQQSLATIQHAQAAAINLGAQHSRELIQQAMQPAVRAIVHKKGLR
jgi:hypothetical protein